MVKWDKKHANKPLGLVFWQSRGKVHSAFIPFFYALLFATPFRWGFYIFAYMSWGVFERPKLMWDLFSEWGEEGCMRRLLYSWIFDEIAVFWTFYSFWTEIFPCFLKEDIWESVIFKFLGAALTYKNRVFQLEKRVDMCSSADVQSFINIWL